MSNNVRLPLLAPPPAPESSGGVLDAHDGELLQVGDLARETGKTVRAIHLYEEIGLLKPAARSKGRFRLYTREALVRIRWIGKLQEMGFSLTDIQQIVRDWEQGGTAPDAMRKMRDVYAKKLEETRANLRRLRTLEQEIESSIAYLDTCDVCDPERLIGFCKACDLHSCESHVPELVAGFRATS
ncbi:MAG: MerR family transcriptional regulator [Polyangiaceae bacterium]|jgi:MerR family transcriptional regulator, copper efflux regulator